MQKDFTHGPITKSILFFSIPLILGNLLQQLYNIVDTFIVGKYLGTGALAAVGSSFSLMAFLTSIILGLCMGSGVVFSLLFGAKKKQQLRSAFFLSFIFVGIVTLLLNAASFYFLDELLVILRIPENIQPETQAYLNIIFCGIFFTFLYNYFASLLRSIGNSVVPLVFLAIAAGINIVLDVVFILHFHMGVSGAALATVIAQIVSAVGTMLYCLKKVPELRFGRDCFQPESGLFKMIVQYSLLTSAQQSIMNFGILMIQGLVNSFGVTVMAAFAAAVKIDAFAYMPVQDFGNAFSTYIAQNYGAKKTDRIRKGIRSAVKIALLFSIVVSLIVFIFAEKLMLCFVQAKEVEVIAIGASYLRIEGAFYSGIGCLFLLYGLYRGLGRSGMSIILTVISLGTRVLLAYLLAPIASIGLYGIWWAIPIGWILADLTGFLYYRRLSFFPDEDCDNDKNCKATSD